MFTQASMLKQTSEHALHHSHPGQVYTLGTIHGGHVFTICLSTEAPANILCILWYAT